MAIGFVSERHCCLSPLGTNFCYLFFVFFCLLLHFRHARVTNLHHLLFLLLLCSLVVLAWAFTLAFICLGVLYLILVAGHMLLLHCKNSVGHIL